jgi:hypothetical protein
MSANLADLTLSQFTSELAATLRVPENVLIDSAIAEFKKRGTTIQTVFGPINIIANPFMKDSEIASVSDWNSLFKKTIEVAKA